VIGKGPWGKVIQVRLRKTGEVGEFFFLLSVEHTIEKRQRRGNSLLERTCFAQN
jgi:hypothetical protein